MFDAAFIETCADHSLPNEIVERFIAAVGTENAVALSITSGNRVILPELQKTPEEAVVLAQRFVSEAVVRGGGTQFPVGVGISEASEISVDLFDACEISGWVRPSSARSIGSWPTLKAMKTAQLFEKPWRLGVQVSLRVRMCSQSRIRDGCRVTWKCAKTWSRKESQRTLRKSGCSRRGCG